MKPSLSFLFLLILAVPAFTAQSAPATAADLVGSWSLAPVESREAASGPGSITLELKLEKGQLAGMAIIPLEQGEKRWPLVHPTFDGKTFSFQVDNGQTRLSGEMQLVAGKFEGRWTSAEDHGEAGRLTMTRKAGSKE